MKKIFHPYSLALLVSVASLGILLYIGCIAPTPEGEYTKVMGVKTESEEYVREPLKDYEESLVIRDQSAYFGDDFVDQHEILFDAFSDATVTYEVYRLRNKTDSTLTIRVIPKKVNDPGLKNMVVKMVVDGGEFELYDHSTSPNSDYFAIALDPYESNDIKLVVHADEVDQEVIAGTVLLQFRK